MASVNTLKRTKATRRHRADRSISNSLRDSESPSPIRERRGSVTFDKQAATVYPPEDPILSDIEVDVDTTSTNQQHEHTGEKTSRNWCFLCRIQVKWKPARFLFRLCALINILSLVFSAPLHPCIRMSSTSNITNNCEKVFIQFTVITVIDFFLAIFYTLQTLARIEYAIHLRRSKTAETPQIFDVPEYKFSADSSPRKREYTGSWFYLRIITLVVITLSLWYSVGIGVYRSYNVWTDRRMPRIYWAYYLFFSVRILSIFTAIKLLNSRGILTKYGLDSLKETFENIRLGLKSLKKIKKRQSQLLYVTLFYLFFIYVYALFGVQWIGGLDKKCVHVDTDMYAIPVTHCTGGSTQNLQRTCYNDSNMMNFVCMEEKGVSPLRIDERNEVYLGQFRTILDAMFAVYEASSWELWIFMDYNALSGAPRHPVFTVFFYLTLFAFLVIFIQQSIFLVVIIESFADLRAESSSETSKPITDKPAIVLSEQQGQSNELHLKLIKQESSTTFQRKFNKWYYVGWRHYISIEILFILLVVVDAVVYASKHTGMPMELNSALFAWQIVVSFLFCVEIAGIIFAHAYYKQLKLFPKSSYFWYLLFIAIGGLVSAGAYQPYYASRPENIFVIFQAARLPRILRLGFINSFFRRLIGNASRLIVVIITVMVFLGALSILTVQIFGYLPEEPECERTGAGQFRNFFTAFQSMFQLVMQEGWTELMGEVMCYRDTWWIFINFGFIILHLLGSLILLNFFVAVILDNLEYDEETKKQKLEEDLKKQKVEKVPLDLQIFKHFGQKTLTGPKLSSVEVPNLTEADVRNFYNVGESTEYPVAFETEQPSFVPDVPTFGRQNSELSNIELLTEDKSEVSSVSTLQGRYYGVQGILNYIKAFRQHSQAVEGNRPGQDLARGRGGYGELDSSRLRQSEYDEYREKYRLFDSALCCLPPDHRFRQFCKKLITFRIPSPKTNPSNDPIPTLSCSQILKKVWSYISYYMCVLFGSASLFSWGIITLTVCTIVVQMYELFIDPSKLYPMYVWISDLIFILATLIDLVLKILVYGLFFNPNGAVRSFWGVLDWLVLMATLAVMIIYLSVCGPEPSVVVTFNPLFVPWWMQTLLLFRALRPFRIISLIPNMRRVIWDVLEGWRSFVRALFLFCLFLFMFASLGVQLFAGDNSKEGFCNDNNMETEQSCVGEFDIFVEISPHEAIPTDDTAVQILVPRVWYDHRRDYRFDHIGVACLTLFQVLTTEGWVQVRDMFGSDAISRRSIESWLMTFYIHTFVFIGVNIVLQFFVGIVVNNYNEHKPNHSALLTVSQKRWSDLVQRISLTRPIKKPPEPRNNRLRRGLYNLFVHPRYRHFATICVLLNSAVLWVPWDETELPDSTQILMGISVGFSFIFLIELILKLVAFGLKYFNSWRNTYDFLVAMYNVSYIVVAIYHLFSSKIDVNRIADMALFLAVFRLFTIHMKYSVLQNLLTTVYKTVDRSKALVGVLVIIVLTYAFVGQLFFSNLRSGEAVDYSMVNFNGIFESIMLVIRVVTGEDWHQILWDAMVEEPYCSSSFGDCGNIAVALIWFITFYMFVSFFLINVVIAVLLESFSIFYEDDDTELNRTVVKDFKQNWFYFDKRASGTVHSSRIKLFLRMLKITKLYTYQINENGVKERQKCDVQSDPLILREMAEELRRDHKQHVTKPDESQAGPGGSGQQLQQEIEYSKENHSFQNVLKMLAHRAEDISKHLVPHELYVREELEQSVQFDVAEDCIFKWMQRFVKPVIANQERQRRQTVAHISRPFGRREDSVMWDAPSLNVPDDWSDAQLSAADTEDESDHLASSLALTSLHGSSFSHLHSSQPKSDDETDVPMDTHVSEKDRNLARSYAKLAEMGPPVDTGNKDKWHDWFKMQSEWMNKVETDPDNYFDDYL